MSTQHVSLVRSGLAALTIALTASLAPAQTTNLLAIPAQWNVFSTSGTGSIQLGSNPRYFWYQSARPGDSFAAIYNTSFTLPTTRDWSLQATAWINPLLDWHETNSDFADLELVVSPTTALANSRITYGLEYDPWQFAAFTTNTEAYRAGAEVDTGVGSSVQLFSYATLRMDYSAADQSISFLFDRDGPGFLFGWEEQDPGNVFSLSGYGLSASDAFVIALAGASEGTSLNYDAFFSDVRATIAIPEASTNALLFGAAALAAVIIRRRFKR